MQRNRADKKNHVTEITFFQLHTRIGRELADAGAFDAPQDHSIGSDTVQTTGLKALNLCMAPGAYTAVLLERHNDATVNGITLPTDLGGHAMCIPYGYKDQRVNLYFLDITMLADEFGVASRDVAPGHPDAGKFSNKRPYVHSVFDLVLCDGQALRTHDRAGYRETLESMRLLTAQLVLGLRRLKSGGTFTILLHKADGYDTLLVLKAFTTFSKLTLFKPKRGHNTRSTFYLIAKDVQSKSIEALRAIKDWEHDWQRATFGADDGVGFKKDEPTDEEIQENLDTFGDELINLASNIWSIQAEALEKVKWTKDNTNQTYNSQRSSPLRAQNINLRYKPGAKPESYRSLKPADGENKQRRIVQPKIDGDKAKKMEDRWR